MNKEILAYNHAQAGIDKKICEQLAEIINSHMPEEQSKVWHGHPVWFLEGNPIVGYSKLKNCVQLLFWSGQSFEEEGLEPEGTFKAAQKRYTDLGQINETELKRWLKKAKEIQWDYKNIVKRKGELIRLK